MSEVTWKFAEAMSTAPHPLFRAGLFSGKAAVVSGGGTGLGLQITRELLSLGCDVLICSRSEQKLSAACAALEGVARAGGCRVVMRACNVKKEAEVRALFEYAVSELRRVDYLVNCGGGQFVSPAENISANGACTAFTPITYPSQRSMPRR